MSDDGGFSPSDLLIDDDSEGVVSRVTSFLGIQREAFVCPSCGVACEETHVHDPARAAFDGGESPAWECPECSTCYIREVGDESYTLDLYGRD